MKLIDFIYATSKIGLHKSFNLYKSYLNNEKLEELKIPIYTAIINNDIWFIDCIIKQFGATEIMKLALDNDGNSVMHLAVLHDKIMLLNLLIIALETNKATMPYNNLYLSPLYFAILYDKKEFIQLLYTRKETFSSVENTITLAMLQGKIELAKTVTELAFNVTTYNSLAYLLINAVIINNQEMISFLLSKGANPFLATSTNITTLAEHTNISIDWPINNNFSAFKIAIEKNNNIVCNLLSLLNNKESIDKLGKEVKYLANDISYWLFKMAEMSKDELYDYSITLSCPNYSFIKSVLNNFGLIFTYIAIKSNNLYLLNFLADNKVKVIDAFKKYYSIENNKDIFGRKYCYAKFIKDIEYNHKILKFFLPGLKEALGERNFNELANYLIPDPPNEFSAKSLILVTHYGAKPNKDNIISYICSINPINEIANKRLANMTIVMNLLHYDIKGIKSDIKYGKFAVWIRPNIDRNLLSNTLSYERYKIDRFTVEYKLLRKICEVIDEVSELRRHDAFKNNKMKDIQPILLEYIFANYGIKMDDIYKQFPKLKSEPRLFTKLLNDNILERHTHNGPYKYMDFNIHKFHNYDELHTPKPMLERYRKLIADNYEENLINGYRI